MLTFPLSGTPWVAYSDPLLFLAINGELVDTDDCVGVVVDPGLLVSAEEDHVMLAHPPLEIFPELQTLCVRGSVALAASLDVLGRIITQLIEYGEGAATIPDSMVVTMDLGPGLLGEGGPHLSVDA